MSEHNTCHKSEPLDQKDSDGQYGRKRKTAGILSLVVLITFFAVMTALLWNPLMSTFSQPQRFRTLVNSHGILGRAAFVGMMALQIVFAIIPGEPMELGAGYAFGTFEGMVLCLIGAALGSAVVFLLTRLFGTKLVEVFIGREKLRSMSFFNQSKNLNLLTFIVFFIPGSPKDIITYFIGLTSMRLKTFLLISSIARIPSVITSTITGNALEAQNYKVAVLVYVATGIISLLGILIYRKISKPNQNKKEPVDSNHDE